VRLGQFPAHVRVSGRGFVSDGSFEYQFLIDNMVYRYFKFTLSRQCRYFVSVLAHDARYCKARFLQLLVVRARVPPSVCDVRGSGTHRLYIL